MADIPASVGYLTVVAKGLVAIADSLDAGSPPDAFPMIARVTIAPSISTPIVAVNEATPKPLIALYTTFHDLDANGVLRPAGDGALPPPSDPSGNIRLIAPNQAAVSPYDWYWTATFTPATGQTWAEFSITFDGLSGATVDLAAVYAAGMPPGSGPAITDPWLTALVKDPDTLIVGNLTYSSGLLTTADVVWPDGATGVLTVVSRDSTSSRAKSWTVTRGALTYTQPTITFNGAGDPTVIPAITVS